MVRLGLLACAVFVAAAGCCTEIGCVGGVVWLLPRSFAPPVETDTVSVHACVDASCFDAVLEWQGSEVWASADGRAWLLTGERRLDIRFPPPPSGARTVSVEVKNNGQLILNDSRQVTFTTSIPNGPFCPPLCSQARVSL